MICNKCGKNNINTNRNCDSCGNQLIFEQINYNYQNIQPKKKSNKWIFIALGCIIGIPIFILGAIFLIAVIVALVNSANDPFNGKWFCSTYDDLNNYSVALDFNSDNNRFNIYKYGDEANNYMTGEYEYNVIKDEDGSYYGLELDVDKYIVDGKLENNISDEYIAEFKESEDTSQMILMDSRGYSKYYCIKR